MGEDDNIGSIVNAVLELQVEGTVVLMQFKGPLPELEDIREKYNADCAALVPGESSIIYMVFAGKDVKTIEGSLYERTKELLAGEYSHLCIVPRIVPILRDDVEQFRTQLRRAKRNLNELSRMIQRPRDSY